MRNKIEWKTQYYILTIQFSVFVNVSVMMLRLIQETIVFNLVVRKRRKLFDGLQHDEIDQNKYCCEHKMNIHK